MTVQHNRTAAVAVRHIHIALVSAAAVHIEVDLQTVVGRIAAAADLGTSADSRSGCVAGTKWFPCTRTTSPKPTRRSSKSRSSDEESQLNSATVMNRNSYQSNAEIRKTARVRNAASTLDSDVGFIKGLLQGGSTALEGKRSH